MVIGVVRQSLSGWVGYTNATNEGSPFKEKTGIWNYAAVATIRTLFRF